MNSLIQRTCLALSVMAGSVIFSRAQPMPQDSWRYDGTNFGSPTAGNSLQVMTAGTGGLYIGEIISGSSSPTKVMNFTENGTFVSRFSASFTHILGMATDSAGNVYVFDRGDSRIKVYSATGTFLRQWGGVGTTNGLFTIPANLNTTNILNISRTDEVFVCDPGNSRVQVFSTAGTFLRKFGEPGNLPGQFSADQPQNIVVGGDGLVWVGQGKRFKTTGEYFDSKPQIRFPSYSFTPYSISADNVCAFRSFYSSFTDSTVTYSPNLYTSAGVIQPNMESETSAFSKKGNFFAIGGTRIRRWIREYSSATDFLNPLPLPQSEVISSSQRPGTNLVDISYRVTDTDSPSVTTALIAFIEGNNTLPYVVPMKTFVENTAGNVGVGQPVDTVCNVVWNMPADWSVTYANAQIEALAKDERNLMGIHWITVPASGNEPAIQVSYQAVEEADLYQLWLWLLATDQGISISRNPSQGKATVTGNGGVFNQLVLADYNISTSGQQKTGYAGRVYALKKMGARPISQAEVERARAGNYGFSGISNGTGLNFIVKDNSTATNYIKGYGYPYDARAYLQTFSTNAPLSLDAGLSHNLLLRTDGSLWGYAANGLGQLGIGNTTEQNTPVKITDGVAQYSAGLYHSAFVKTDGTLWTMGYNSDGQLGDGSTTQRNSPIQVATGVAQVSAGQYHTLFVKTDGTLWAMGRNNYGQLGDTTNSQRTTPVQIATGVSKAEAGGACSFYIKTNGTLWATGYNANGQQGTGNTTQRNTPIQVATGVASVSASLGEYNESPHTLMVKTDGTLWVTGNNGYGQLGDGTSTQRTSFAQIATGVSKASAGRYFSAFRKTDGTVWTMGNNNYGQLGDGTTTNRNTPGQVAANVTDFSTGTDHLVILVPAAP